MIKLDLYRRNRLESLLFAKNRYFYRFSGNACFGALLDEAQKMESSNSASRLSRFVRRLLE
jgi:hypothetical protein